MRNLKTSGGLTHGGGMSEAQRNAWALSMPVFTKVHESMQEICETVRHTGEQNTDVGSSRVHRDWKDTTTVSEYLRERNPFLYEEDLCNIATGVHAHTSVNIDEANKVGEKIVQKMIGATISQFSFKRKNQAVNMAAKSAVKVDGAPIDTVSPQLLFQRFTIAARTKNDPEKAFAHELCNYPPAMFDSPGFLREASKSTLAEFIWTNFGIEDSTVPSGVKFVIDGGALLHRIPWERGATFRSIIKKYTDYVIRRYGEAMVIFDGYDSASTKDMTHRRRLKGRKGVKVSFALDMNLTESKDLFLSDSTNKQRFINILGEQLHLSGSQVFHAKSDADLLIVLKAVESAKTMKTVLVGDDTDLLVLLLYHTKLHSFDIYFAPEPKMNSKCRTWDIKKVKAKLGSLICSHILFLHAMLGCDATSRLYNVGKATILKKFKANTTLHQSAEIFNNPNSTAEEIESAGERALVNIYNGKSNESLNTLRYRRYCEKVATNTSQVEPRTLPPTSAAAKFHSYRVFLQACQWKSLDCDLSPELWGWTKGDAGLSPTMTDLPPAPDDLLKIIRCN